MLSMQPILTDIKINKMNKRYNIVSETSRLLLIVFFVFAIKQQTYAYHMQGIAANIRLPYAGYSSKHTLTICRV